jgi:hypothetical protein
MRGDLRGMSHVPGMSLGSLPLLVQCECAKRRRIRASLHAKASMAPKIPNRRFAWKAARRRMGSACRARGSLCDMPGAS